jgi:hypothetical protein
MMHPKRLENRDATCPRHSRKEYRPLIEAAWSAGWWCERRANNYIHCYPPEDDDLIVVRSTPGQRHLRKVRGKFRQHGLPV